MITQMVANSVVRNLSACLGVYTSPHTNAQGATISQDCISSVKGIHAKAPPSTPCSKQKNVEKNRIGRQCLMVTAVSTMLKDIL
jgi:hypothetical protein